MRLNLRPLFASKEVVVACISHKSERLGVGAYLCLGEMQAECFRRLLMNEESGS
jgi:hypothetical protein